MSHSTVHQLKFALAEGDRRAARIRREEYFLIATGLELFSQACTGVAHRKRTRHRLFYPRGRQLHCRYGEHRDKGDSRVPGKQGRKQMG